jgi:hypothetical protein
MTLPPSPCHLSEEEIMIKDIEKIEKARLIIQKIADGTNPINGQPVEADSFLHDSRIIRCFYFISEVLEAVQYDFFIAAFCNYLYDTGLLRLYYTVSLHMLNFLLIYLFIWYF